ncbi:MAG: hypothetical protein IKT61_01625 [Clostridia bacterium]|nr:hypothetical protein [Clostridia bacterium]
MKKAFIFIAFAVVIMSVLTACEKKNDDTLTTTSKDDYSLTEPSYTVGAVATSEKAETGENTYEIRYFDANGVPARCDYYRDGKLAYYCVYSGTDEAGNAVQEKYYTADGQFVAIYDNGIFFDESGNRLTEDEATGKLN